MPVDEYECGGCGVMFSTPLFDISSASEQMIDTPDKSYPFEVDIRGSMGLACFCSSVCRDKERIAIMKAEGVPIPAERPVYKPIESCAVCNGSVDMHEWHLTFTESTVHDSGQVDDVDYLAVVCPSCESKLLKT